MIDRASFFAAVRTNPFGGSLLADEVDGMTKILDEWDRRLLSDARWLAYMLATTFHETGRKMQPIREGGSEAYLKAKPYYPWVGEGLVQVTWEVNAKKFGATKPGDCLSWPVALSALFDGMIDGVFTGKKLATYFNALTDDPVGARRIINGTDKAALIAGYHAAFLTAIKAASAGSASSALKVPAAPVIPPPPPISKPKAAAASAVVVAAGGAVAAGSHVVNVPLWPCGVLGVIGAGVWAFFHFRK